MTITPTKVASLQPGQKQLILIGDHKQLPPIVQSMDLRTKHGFGISLMQRLIERGAPHAQLMCQKRMDPEIAE